VRTIFNILGPLANPARADYQLLGVGRLALLDTLAEALARLGTRHALLVCGEDGLDEVSLSAPTQVRVVRDGRVTSLVWAPEDFGLARCNAEELHADGPAQSAAIIRGVLNGADGAARRIVLVNAAAALLAAECAASPREGVTLAQAAIDSQRARDVLEKLIACSNES
jgi:anthranilate phosphoribosyltransferase